ncbi:MarR family transcriptional regulator [Bradyrhizobium sp. CCBAU 051011]|nr:MarR family transcriptional regulator [Bradyrhizobium sp. CCBAU 051011]
MPTSSPDRRCMSAAEPALDRFPSEITTMDATVKRKARSPKGTRGQALRPVEPAHESDGAHLELRIWLRLLSCATRIEKALNARLRKEFNTTLARFDLLAQLTRKPEGATMSEVSELLMVSNGAITALVQKLEADGLIHREVDSEDRRTFRLRLSQEGAKEFGRMARRHEEWVIALIGELSPVAQSDLLQHLTLLKRRLDKHS